MDRRRFLELSATSIAGLTVIHLPMPVWGRSSGGRHYSVLILGDTHFDTDPESVYHSDYREPDERRNKIHREESARNRDMWRDRCPRLLKRCASLADGKTRLVLQTGDIVQGDCGNGDVHRKMLNDAMGTFKKEFAGLPLVTVVGNHDIRGVGAEEAYHAYMPSRMSEELGKEIHKTTFYFWIGPDAFLLIDFNRPDDEEIEKMLRETDGARHTFIVSHGPVFPMDAKNCRWIFHGGASKWHTAARRHFRSEFAKRNAIVLCGHSHVTALTEWKGEEGIITQMEMNSVWAKDKHGEYEVITDSPSQYGMMRKKLKDTEGKALADESSLFDEYRPGLTRYIYSKSAGSYKLNVGPRHVTLDFYAGASEEKSCTFVLR